jgi:hypothetical protein
MDFKQANTQNLIHLIFVKRRHYLLSFALQRPIDIYILDRVLTQYPHQNYQNPLKIEDLLDLLPIFDAVEGLFFQ